MIIQPIDYFLVVWFILAGLSTAYVAWDQFRNNPEPPVMKWGFILITLYMGVFGLLLYVLADKEPRPGTHEEFVSPLWKQAIGSTIHCYPTQVEAIRKLGDQFNRTRLTPRVKSLFETWLRWTR